MPLNNSDDLGESYTTQVAQSSQAADAAEMRQWSQSIGPDPMGQPQVNDTKRRPLPQPKPARTPTDDTLGRTEPQPDKEEGTVSKVTRNVAEMPGQIAAGANDAVENAFSLFDKMTGGTLSTLDNWLNDHVADLRFDVVPDARTGTGQITRKISEFMTGFATGGRYLKALGVSNAAVKTVGAGLIADFVARSPQEGRLADLWNDLGLPKNVLTDYLQSKPTDTDAEARFKNALEGVGLSGLMEGVFLGARALRALRGQPGVRQSEEDILRAKYGEIQGGEGEPLSYKFKPSSTAAKTDEGRRGFLQKFGGLVASKVLPFDVKSLAHGVEDMSDEALAQLAAREIETHLTAPSVEALLKSGLFATDKDGAIVATKLFDKSTPEQAAQLIREAHATLQTGSITENISRVIGDPTKPMIEIRVKRPSEIGAKVKKGMEGTEEYDPRAVIRSKKETGFVLPDDFEVAINFARIDEPNNIKFAMGKMAEALKSHIDEARRGSITHAQTEKLADELGMTVPELLARRQGQAFNAEEALAARQLWAASAEKLVETAKAAAAKNAGPLDQYAFRKMMGTHAAIQNEVMGMRAEAGRALSQWNIVAGSGGIEKARAIQQMMEAMGGPQVSAEMAKRLAIFAEEGATPAMLARFAEKGAGAASLDAIKEVWINGLLSSPKTHVVNVTSNALVAMQQIFERQAAEGVRAFVGGEGVVPGEAVAMTRGLIEAVPDAFRLAAKAIKYGKSGWGFNKIDLARPNAVSPEAFGMARDTGMGRFVDYLGKTIGVPGRLLTAEDEFFRTIGYRMNVRAEALRTATHEGLDGERLALRYKELVDNPSEAIRINAADAALYQTFTNEVGKFGKWMMSGRNIEGLSGLGVTLVLPFVRTPVNIARYAFERTPFAPLVGQWRADIAAGGARADLALARMGTGTAVMLAVMDMADRGEVTGEGPRDKDSDVREALLRQKWQPYSMRIGDKWYSYNRMDPLGMTMGFAASISEAVKKGEMDQDSVDEWQEVAAMAIAAVSQVAISKTYLEGLAKFFEVVTDPKRYSQKYIDDLVASFIPAASLSNAVKNMVDPVQREVNTPWDAIQSRIAGLSKNLTPRRDLWGREIKYESGMGKAYDFFSPVQVGQEEKSSIDKEMVRLGNAPQRIQKNSVFAGVQANMRFYPEVYDEYTRLAGNDLKSMTHGGLGAKDYLDQVVSGKHPLSAVYNILSDESRQQFITHTIRDYRREAQQSILQNPKFKDFAAEISKLQEIHQQSRMPVLGAQ